LIVISSVNPVNMPQTTQNTKQSLHQQANLGWHTRKSSAAISTSNYEIV